MGKASDGGSLMPRKVKFVINEVLHIQTNFPDKNGEVDIVGFHLLEYRNNAFCEKTRIEVNCKCGMDSGLLTDSCLEGVQTKNPRKMSCMYVYQLL
jgi:hypothetical protein